MRTFAGLHPLSAAVYAAAVLITAMFVQNPVIQLTALLSGAALCFLFGNRGNAKADSLFYLLLFAVVTLTNPLFSHNGVTPLFYMNENPVTLEAIACGAGMACMIISVILWCKGAAAFLTNEKYMYLAGRAFPKLALVLSMTLRFIPQFIRQAEKVRRAQKSLLGGCIEKGLSGRVHGALRIMSAMIGWSMENAAEKGAAMKARGYGAARRTSYSNYRFRPADCAVMSLSLAASVIVAAAGAAGEITFNYYPAMVMSDVSLFALGAYAFYGVVCFMPVIIKLAEDLKWKYCVSKI